MKRIIQAAVVAIACSAGAAWSQSQEQMPQASQSTESSVSVAQASIPERAPIAREQAQPRKMSLHESTGLAGDGAFPSRGGPQDD
jgi:hypothetical protein